MNIQVNSPLLGNGLDSDSTFTALRAAGPSPSSRKSSSSRSPLLFQVPRRLILLVVVIITGATLACILLFTTTTASTPEYVNRIIQTSSDVASNLSKPLVKLVGPLRSTTTTCSPSSSNDAPSYPPVVPPSSSSSSSSSTLPCDPFTSPGQLEVQQGQPDANLWRPWNTASCNASTLFTDLRERKHMPWLHNKTLAIFGDSIDRDHIEYFCEMSRGNMEWIWEGTRFDPSYTFSPGDPHDYTADGNGQDTGGGDQSRPRICYVDHYDFAVVFAFHYGLSDGSDTERALPHFYPPFRLEDRLQKILIPILKAADRFPPTMVEFSTGTWDLQHWTFEDRELEKDRMTPISPDRAAWYQERFVAALQAVQEAFPASSYTTTASSSKTEDDGQPSSSSSSSSSGQQQEPSLSNMQRDGTALLFREMQHIKMVDSVPPPRVHGLKDLQAVLLEDEDSESRRWQIDPLARLLIGQEHFYRDSIHPIQLPAGKIWADIILHKLWMHSLSQ